jgi:hypothetical protein
MISLFGTQGFGFVIGSTGTFSFAVGVAIIAVPSAPAGAGDGLPHNLPLWFTPGRLRSM